MPTPPQQQASLVGHVHGGDGGYAALIVATDARHSEAMGSTGTLIRLAGIGRLEVACSRKPRGRFVLTHFAAGEGPPDAAKTASATNGRTSLPSYTRDLVLSVARRKAHHQQVETWQVDGGGEAFQFAATITDLLTPTPARCDLLAQATVVTHGPFYHYAHASP